LNEFWATGDLELKVLALTKLVLSLFSFALMAEEV
jgi:hypothetical protein